MEVVGFQRWIPVYSAARQTRSSSKKNEQQHLSLNAEPGQLHVNILLYQ